MVQKSEEGEGQWDAVFYEPLYAHIACFTDIQIWRIENINGKTVNKCRWGKIQLDATELITVEEKFKLLPVKACSREILNWK